MKSKQTIFALPIVLFCMSVSSHLYSQVHIALPFGEKFPAHEVKLGLERGLSFSNITSAEETKSVRNLNLGLFLDVQLKETSRWYLHTGLQLNSGMGAKEIDVYSLNDAGLDSAFNGGKIERQLKYINIPALVRYKFSSHFFIEMGPRFGLLTKATDIFHETGKQDDGLYYKNNVTDRCRWFDAGIKAGIGYHLMRGKGVNLGLRYYLGMLELFSDNPPNSVRNKSLSIFLNIPIVTGNHEK
jgi:hypothetical protein